jgi:lauroyl/myristoyl acyltransferase
MKKMWFLVAILIGLMVGLALPFEWRAKLSRPLADLVARMVENMPDE